jgi:hypothetical protein
MWHQDPAKADGDDGKQEQEEFLLAACGLFEFTPNF